MNTEVKKCARVECGKTVYQLEELKCLDKIWHKQCFRCSVCGMVLSMKNYKGYEKMPYCEAHYPKTVASVCNDTPEMRRLRENTKNQSMAKYHEDFERQRGTKINIVDDPELARHRKNMQVTSNAAYHGELEKKQHMEEVRPPIIDDVSGRSVPPYDYQQQPAQPYLNGYSNGNQHADNATSPYSARMQQASTLVYSSDQGGSVALQQQEGGGRAVGSIADYDPLNGRWGSATTAGKYHPPTVLATNPPPPTAAAAAVHSPVSPGKQPSMPQQARLPQTQRQSQLSPKAPTATEQQQQKQPAKQAPHTAAAPYKVSGVTMRAIYDYTAADTDEVTFVEGDLIVNSQSVDEGWMTGTVKRTNQWGMLPANYVERLK